MPGPTLTGRWVVANGHGEELRPGFEVNQKAAGNMADPQVTVVKSFPESRAGAYSHRAFDVPV